MNGENWTEKEFGEAERVIGYRFRDRSLLLTAFTHSSYAAATGAESNERLEFLGDAVLQLVVTEMLIRRSSEDEGALTELRKQYVSRTALDGAEERTGLMRFLRYFGSESNVGGKTRSNLFEAVAGAVYLDGGLEAARQFLKEHLLRIETENYKTILQEYVQERENKTPVYRTQEAEEGFFCKVTALGVSAEGAGSSKKAAETAAAKALYGKFNKGNHA